MSTVGRVVLSRVSQPCGVSRTFILKKLIGGRLLKGRELGYALRIFDHEFQFNPNKIVRIGSARWFGDLFFRRGSLRQLLNNEPSLEEEHFSIDGDKLVVSGRKSILVIRKNDYDDDFTIFVVSREGSTAYRLDKENNIQFLEKIKGNKDAYEIRKLQINKRFKVERAFLSSKEPEFELEPNDTVCFPLGVRRKNDVSQGMVFAKFVFDPKTVVLPQGKPTEPLVVGGVPWQALSATRRERALAELVVNPAARESQPSLSEVAKKYVDPELIEWCGQKYYDVLQNIVDIEKRDRRKDSYFALVPNASQNNIMEMADRTKNGELNALEPQLVWEILALNWLLRKAMVDKVETDGLAKPCNPVVWDQVVNGKDKYSFIAFTANGTVIQMDQIGESGPPYVNASFQRIGRRNKSSVAFRGLPSDIELGKFMSVQNIDNTAHNEQTSTVIFLATKN